MEYAPLKEPMYPQKVPTETKALKIRREMVGQVISKKEYDEAVAAGLENLPDDYIVIYDSNTWENGGKNCTYYKIPKVSNEELQVIIADKTRQAAEEAVRHVRHIKYIIIALVVLGIVGRFILNQALANLF